MRNPADPPVKHILRPHHINLLAIIVLTFGTFEGPPDGPLPGPFLLHLYRILIRELSEVSVLVHDIVPESDSLQVMEPKGFGDLMTEIMRGPMGDLTTAQSFYHKFSSEVGQFSLRNVSV